MVEQDHSELTQAEAELYDRQIRLWGLENQKRFEFQEFVILLLLINSISFKDCEAQRSSSQVSTDWALKSARTSSWLV